MKRSTIVLLIFATLQVCAVPKVAAGTTDAQILQFKLDRFYLNVGKEALVYPGHHFAIMRGKDTVVAGLIEESYDGVSIGRGPLPKDGRRNFEKYKCIVETADVERLSTVRMGALNGELVPFETGAATPLDSLAQRGRATYVMGPDTLRVKYEDDTLTILDLLDRGEIDGAVVAGGAAIRPGFHVRSSITPLFVTMLSNPINDSGGILATSLYYRFDSRRLHTSMADSAMPVNSFLTENAAEARPYPFDPEKGKRLFQSINPRPSFVHIGITTEQLRPVAMYFADLLAREQCRSSIAIDTAGTQSDLILLTGMTNDKMPQLMPQIIGYFLHALHQPGDTADGPAYLSRFQAALDSIDAADDTLKKQQYLTRANDILIHDFGCFPLFRPRYSLITREDITGVNFDERGRVQLSNPRRIKLPAPPARVTR